MLDNTQIEQNKERFLSILNQLPELTDMNRLYRFDALIDMLNNSDWFIAPGSTKYHHAWEGGLCQHSLEVYDNLKEINEKKCLGYTEDSIIICGLLHDLAKVNYYEPTSFNKKIDGKWVAIPGYKTTDNPIPFGNHEETSAWMIRQYIGLTFDEEVAILNHHAGMSFDSVKQVSSRVWNNNLFVALHLADMMSAYIDNSKDKVLC